MSKKGGFPQKSGGYGQQNRPQQSNYGNRPQQSNYGRGDQSRQKVPADPSLLEEIPTVNAVDNVKRKWVGTRGMDCELIANYFNMILNCVRFFRYCVDIQFVNQKDEKKETDESKKEKPIMNRMMRRRVLWEFLRQNISVNDKFKLVYDDCSILYSTVDILEDASEREGEFNCDDYSTNETKRVKVRIWSKEEGKVDMQFLNLLLTQYSRHPFLPAPLRGNIYCEIDRRFLEPEIGFQPLGVKNCLHLLRGLDSSVKIGPGNIHLANYDLKHSTFLNQGINLLEFYALAKRIELPSRDRWPELEKMSMDVKQRKEMNSILRGVLLSRNYGDERIRRINKRFVKVHNKTARSATISRDGQTQTIERYFATKYGIRLVLPNLPLVHIGRVDGKMYIPMELLKIADKRQRLRMILPDDLQAMTTEYTTVYPLERFNIIRQAMQKTSVGNDPIANAFGVSVDLRMLKIHGRILPVVNVQHRNKTQKPFGEAIFVNKLAVVNVNNAIRDDYELRTKTKTLVEECSKYGLRFNGPTTFKNLQFNKETDLENWLGALKNELGPNSLSIFIPNNRDTNFYDELKFLADVKLGLHTQVIRPRTFGKIGGFTINSNLFRKLISKVGGASMKVDKSLWPEFTNTKEPTLFIGVDVTHPAPSDKTFPSIAAIVSNLDIDATTYGATIRIQPSRTEEVLSIGEMFLKRVEAFKQSIGSYPKRVVYLRDGVADSQFKMVIDSEMQSMKRKCSKAGVPEPKFTVIIVQKRHTTRFYAKDCGDNNGNVKPGTVVDRYITSEEQKNFFLCAHKGLLGTSKPINYWVIHDDCDLTADSIQNSANLLCNVFSRAAGPVSLPAPVYYAHLVCFRARSYANYLRSKGEPVNEELPERFTAHDDLQQFMYFS